MNPLQRPQAAPVPAAAPDIGMSHGAAGAEDERVAMAAPKRQVRTLESGSAVQTGLRVQPAKDQRRQRTAALQ